MKIKETKEKILEALGDEKEFEVSYWEEVQYCKKFKASSKEELEKQFNDGELEFDGKDIIDGNFMEDSLEIDEVEN